MTTNTATPAATTAAGSTTNSGSVLSQFEAKLSADVKAAVARVKSAFLDIGTIVGKVASGGEVLIEDLGNMQLPAERAHEGLHHLRRVQPITHLASDRRRNLRQEVLFDVRIRAWRLDASGLGRALDLLGRKVPRSGTKGYTLRLRRRRQR